MADDVWAWCEKAQSLGRTVTVNIKFGDFRQITRSRSFPNAIDAQASLRTASLELLRSIYPLVLGRRLVGVTVSLQWTGVVPFPFRSAWRLL